MTKTHRVVGPLRVLLVLLFAALVVGQIMSVPGEFAQMAREAPDRAHLRWPLTILGVLVLLCVQVVIVSTWNLLTLVKEDRIFSERSQVWVDAIMWAVGVAWLLIFGLFVFVGLNADDPASILLLGTVLMVGAVFGLLLVVMRALLRRATTLRTDLEGVI
jgi:protein-S-isoprenylcysteine O-methyltransferase Ste14